MSSRAVSSVDQLGERRRRVALLLADGFTDKHIGAKLGMSTATVRKHLWYLGRQLGVPGDKDARLVIVRWIVESQCATALHNEGSTICA